MNRPPRRARLELFFSFFNLVFSIIILSILTVPEKSAGALVLIGSQGLR